MLRTFRLLTATVAATLLLSATTPTTAPVFDDETRTYAVPTLVRGPKNGVALTWTEKDAAGVVSLYVARSADAGRTFQDKQLIFAGPGISGSRLFRPKLLFRPNGEMVMVFANRVESAAPQPAAPAGDHAGHANHDATAKETPKKDSRPRDTQIVFATSKDGGQTWTAPQPVHPDRTPMVRGFFDATVLANGNVAVTYLRDIEGQPHSRDLRLVVQNGSGFGPEKVLDPFTCDCCNISLLVDAAGALHVYFRENKDNIRDIDHLVSTDNGATFAAPKNLYADNWKLNGCPHSGPTSVQLGKSALIAWHSGTEVNQPGIRVVTQEGKRLFVLDQPTAKNAWLLPGNTTSAVLLWEQTGNGAEAPASTIAYRTIGQNGTSSDTRWVAPADLATNATGVVVGNQLVVAYELKRAGKPNAVKVTTVAL